MIPAGPGLVPYAREPSSSSPNLGICHYEPDEINANQREGGKMTLWLGLAEDLDSIALDLRVFFLTT